MPFIRLRTATFRAGDPSVRYLDEQSREQAVPLLRLRLGIVVGSGAISGPPGKRLTYDAILDTGSPLTIFPKHVWQDFAAELVRLQVVGNRPLIARAGGRQFHYFLGRVWVGALDLFGRRLPAVPVLAQFREDDIPVAETQPPILIGLWNGILEGRSLTRWPTAERFDPDIPTLESFGQWWRLADS